MGGNEGNLLRNVIGYDGFVYKICIVRYSVRLLDFLKVIVNGFSEFRKFLKSVWIFYVNI